VLVELVCYHTSRREEVFDEDGHPIEYWIVSPVPMVDAKTVIGFDNKPIQPAPAHFIEIIKIEGGKALAQIATLAPILAEAIKKKLHLEKERNNYAQLYDQEVNAHQRTNMEKEELKHLLTQKIYVGREVEPVIPKSIMNAGWILATGITVFFFVVVLPEYLTSMDLIIAQMIGMGVGLGMIMMLWAWVSGKEKAPEQKRVEGRT